MAKVKPAARAESRPSDAGPWAAYGSSWTVAFAILSILFLVLVSGPLSRISVRYSAGYDEGNAAYLARQSVAGPGIYSTPPRFAFAGHPPLGYHVAGNLARWSGDANTAGRWVSLFSYLWIGICAGLIVHRLTASPRCGVYAAFCWLIWLAALDPARIAYNDPHLLGVAFGIAGLYCFVRDSASPQWLTASAVLFSLGLFTSQSLVAFPCAVAIQLFLTNRKRLVLWIVAAAAACVVSLVLTLAIDGPSFLRHLMAPHTLSFSYFAENITAYAAVLQVAFVAALIWSLRQAAGARDRLLVWAFGLAHVIGSLLSFGSGAVINPFLDAMLSLVLIAGVGLPLLLRLVEGTRFPVAALALLLLVPFFLRAALEIPRRWNYDSTVDSLRVRHEGEFASLAEFLRKQPGPALCENPLLCYEAGKPRDFDAADLSALVKTGGLPEAALLQMLERREFGAVQLEWGNEPVRPSARKRFSEAFLLKLFATYKPAIRTSDALIFTPVK